MKNFLAKIWRNPKYLVIIFGLVVILLSLMIGWIIYHRRQLIKNQEEILVIDNQEEEGIVEEKAARRLDGVLVDNSEEANLVPLAVMIDNFIEARPPAGLAQANLVFEAPVEANISRFLAVYAISEEVPMIGPVRSARPYYLDWAKELGALYIHVGGSEEALNKINLYDIYDINEYYNSKYFWRDKTRYAPHNVYTSTELLYGYVGEERQANFESWLYKEEIPLAERPQTVPSVSFEFRDDDYRIEWKYDRLSNEYVRWQGEEPHQDEDGEFVKAKNIVIQYASIWVLDEVGRRKIETIGSGEALIYRDGKEFKATWRKSSREERTRYYDEAGEEIAFNRGTTWVEVLEEE